MAKKLNGFPCGGPISLSCVAELPERAADVAGQADRLAVVVAVLVGVVHVALLEYRSVRRRIASLKM